ncbi:MAG: thermostable hemolysin [Nitrospirae bacterium]|nr:thermostable hemolysin [Nitrospirota bacterium]
MQKSLFVIPEVLIGGGYDGKTDFPDTFARGSTEIINKSGNGKMMKKVLWDEWADNCGTAQKLGNDKSMCKATPSFRRIKTLLTEQIGELAGLELIERDNPQWHILEGFVMDVYYRKYNAKIHPYCQSYLAINGWRGEMLGCVGMNKASSPAFFCEQYLDMPVERYISMEKFNAPTHVKRGCVTEIGNMASHIAGFGYYLIPAVTGLLNCMDTQYITFTATNGLRNLFASLGIRLNIIVSARKEKLTGAPDTWGTYYESDPAVAWIDIEKEHKYLEELLSIDPSNPLYTGMLAAFNAGVRLGSANMQKRQSHAGMECYK